MRSDISLLRCRIFTWDICISNSRIKFFINIQNCTLNGACLIIKHVAFLILFHHQIDINQRYFCIRLLEIRFYTCMHRRVFELNQIQYIKWTILLFLVNASLLENSTEICIKTLNQSIQKYYMAREYVCAYTEHYKHWQICIQSTRQAISFCIGSICFHSALLTTTKCFFHHWKRTKPFVLMVWFGKLILTSCNNRYISLNIFVIVFIHRCVVGTHWSFHHIVYFYRLQKSWIYYDYLNVDFQVY